MTTIFKPSEKLLSFPKRIIISLTAHGNIIIDKKGKEKVFTMPEGISVKKSGFSVPGVCNFFNTDDIDYYVRTINLIKGKLTRMNYDEIDEFLQMFNQVIKDHDKEYTYDHLTSLLKCEKTLTPESCGVDDMEELDEYVNKSKDYLHYFFNSFRVSTFLPGDTVIDKLYSRENEEVPRSRRQWVIRIINMPGTLDLITLLRPQTRRGEPIIYLSEIINYLQSNGVEEVILFDFSCSYFTNEMFNSIDPRSIRYKRKNLITSSIKYGGKTKKNHYRKKKSKNKKGKTNKRF